MVRDQEEAEDQREGDETYGPRRRPPHVCAIFREMATCLILPSPGSCRVPISQPKFTLSILPSLDSSLSDFVICIILS